MHRVFEVTILLPISAGQTKITFGFDDVQMSLESFKIQLWLFKTDFLNLKIPRTELCVKDGEKFI